MLNFRISVVHNYKFKLNFILERFKLFKFCIQNDLHLKNPEEENTYYTAKKFQLTLKEINKNKKKSYNKEYI